MLVKNEYREMRLGSSKLAIDERSITMTKTAEKSFYEAK